MTTEELVTEALGHQFNQDRYHDRMIRWMNEAQQRIYTEARLTGGESTVDYLTTVGVNTYDYTNASPTETLVGLISLRIPDEDIELQQLDIDYFDALDESSGQPNSFTIFGDEIAFYPTPDAEYRIQIKGYLMPTEIDEDTAPTLESKYQYLLVEYALMKAYAAEHDSRWADYHQNLFEQGLMRLRGDEQQKREGGVRVVPGLVGGNLYG